eukprot:390207_1
MTLLNIMLYLIVIYNTLHCDAISKSKLTLFSGMGSLSWQFINATKPQSLKIFDSFGENPKMVKSISPETIIIGRIYISNQPMDGDPCQRAQEWWSQVNNTILTNPDVDYWEGYNEVVGGGNDENTLNQMKWYTQMEICRMQIMSNYSVKACIGNFATGCPQVENQTIINAWLPAMKSGLEYDAILGLHEYSAPFVETCYNSSEGFGWLTGRYRLLYNNYFIPNNLVLKLSITEAGIDGQVGCNYSPIIGGWQDFCNWWKNNGGQPPNDCQQDYTNQLIWYDSIMLNDDYVIGADIFCIDIPGWSSWQLNQGVVTDLITYMNGL